MRVLLLGFVLAGCATHYSYRFERVEPGSEDDVALEATLDPSTTHEIALNVTNRTSAPVQIAWTKIVVNGPGERRASLKPESDLGWVAPGATVRALLTPFTLPTSEKAKARDGARMELVVPMTVLNEARVMHCAFVAHVEAAP